MIIEIKVSLEIVSVELEDNEIYKKFNKLVDFSDLTDRGTVLSSETDIYIDDFEVLETNLIKL